MSAPLADGSGAGRAMSHALKRAGLNADQVGYVNAHGTSTPMGDICETLAIKRVFGEGARNVQVSSTKSMTGHMLGAAGAVEMAACLKVLETGIIPPTINLDNPDEQCDLDYVPNTARESKVTAVMNNSFGFGGHNSSLVAVKI
jgi:3-oxoacyl-[acyl-carrier-protein] synthase II